MNIKELAKQAGFDVEDKVGEIWFDEGWHTSIVERFAELVAAAEREECAELCEAVGHTHDVLQGAELAFDLAEAIRARGDK